MSGVDKTFGVRISGAEGPDAREIAETIGPVVDSATDELISALNAGPVLVAVELGFEEAEQFANVLANLGATPEVVQRVAGDDTWLPIPFERTPPPGGEIADTAAMDLRQVRARLDAIRTGPPITGIEETALLVALGGPVESLPPIVLDQMRELAAGPPPPVVNEPPPPVTHVPPPRVSSTVEVSLGVIDSRVDVEELSQAALDHALRAEAERLKAAGAPIPDDINLNDPDSTQRFDRPGDRPQRAPGLQTTQRFGQLSPPQQVDPAQDTRATASFQRPGQSDITRTSSFSERELGALILKMDAPEAALTASGFMPHSVDLAAAAAELPNLTPLAAQETDGGEPVRLTTVPNTPTPAPAFEGAERPPDEAFDPEPPADEAPHAPGNAALLGLFIPGMGQVYNGERERGVWFALGAVLVVPWIYGVIDAWRRAREIVRGQRARPLTTYARSASLAHIALVLAIVCGVSLGRAFLPYLRTNTEPVAERIVVERPAPRPALPASVAAPAPEPIRPAMDQGEVESLLLRGRDACERGLYAECGLLMDAILASHPGQPEALKLLSQASAHEK